MRGELGQSTRQETVSGTAQLPYQRAVERISEAANLLEKTITDVESRLESYMAPEEPEQVGENAERLVKTEAPAVEVLGHLAAQVENQAGRLEKLLRRLHI